MLANGATFCQFVGHVMHDVTAFAQVKFGQDYQHQLQLYQLEGMEWRKRHFRQRVGIVDTVVYKFQLCAAYQPTFLLTLRLNRTSKCETWFILL